MKPPPLIRIAWILLAILATGHRVIAADAAVAAAATNQLGIEILGLTSPADRNALISPYSIQSALAMTYAGSAGATKAEMAKVLHYPADEANLHSSFKALHAGFDEAVRGATRSKVGSGERPPTLVVANRLFGQQGYPFRNSYLDFVGDSYQAPLQMLDFRRHAEAGRGAINRWVEDQTQQRIRNLLPWGAVHSQTRLVLVNAVYFQVPWQTKFDKSSTQPRPFLLGTSRTVPVPTLARRDQFAYLHQNGYTAVAVPYRGGELQFLVLLPDDRGTGALAALTRKLTPRALAAAGSADKADVILELPKLKLEPPVMPLGATLRALGMTTAFDQPRGSANFERMAPRQSEGGLAIEEVFHQAFLDLDEQGTEAAAATAVTMVPLSARIGGPPPKLPILVKIDHPYLFAIQHRRSGACLFLGRVTDPR